jgi:hypothetical protein
MIQRAAGAVLMCVAVLSLAVAVWLLAVSFHLGLAMLALWFNVGIFLVGITLATGPPCTAGRAVFLVAVATFGCLVIVRSEQMSYQRRFNVWWQSSPQIEIYLRSQTSVGATEEQVLDWLHQHAPIQPNIGWSHVHRASILPHSELSTTGGEAFIQSALHHEPERLIPLMFSWDVEAFYTFDAAGRLVDVRVRTTVNGL